MYDNGHTHHKRIVVKVGTSVLTEERGGLARRGWWIWRDSVPDCSGRDTR